MAEDARECDDSHIFVAFLLPDARDNVLGSRWFKGTNWKAER
jgi:hypothetical protein